MTGSVRAEGIVEGRLSKVEYDANFSDIHPPLSRHEAFVESETGEIMDISESAF